MQFLKNILTITNYKRSMSLKTTIVVSNYGDDKMSMVNITEAELEIMKVLWKNDAPMSSYDICERLKDKTWKYTTVSTLLSRLAEKGAIRYEKTGKFYLYTPILCENTYKIRQTKNLVSKIYDGSIKNLIVSLFENEDMSEQDIQEIKELFKLY